MVRRFPSVVATSQRNLSTSSWHGNDERRSLPAASSQDEKETNESRNESSLWQDNPFVQKDARRPVMLSQKQKSMSLVVSPASGTIQRTNGVAVRRRPKPSPITSQTQDETTSPPENSAPSSRPFRRSVSLRQWGPSGRFTPSEDNHEGKTAGKIKVPSFLKTKSHTAVQSNAVASKIDRDNDDNDDPMAQKLTPVRTAFGPKKPSIGADESIRSIRRYESWTPTRSIKKEELASSSINMERAPCGDTTALAIEDRKTGKKARDFWKTRSASLAVGPKVTDLNILDRLDTSPMGNKEEISNAVELAHADNRTAGTSDQSVVASDSTDRKLGAKEFWAKKDSTKILNNHLTTIRMGGVEGALAIPSRGGKNAGSRFHRRDGAPDKASESGSPVEKESMEKSKYPEHLSPADESVADHPTSESSPLGSNVPPPRPKSETTTGGTGAKSRLAVQSEITGRQPNWTAPLDKMDEEMSATKNDPDESSNKDRDDSEQGESWVLPPIVKRMPKVEETPAERARKAMLQRSASAWSVLPSRASSVPEESKMSEQSPKVSLETPAKDTQNDKDPAISASKAPDAGAMDSLSASKVATVSKNDSIAARRLLFLGRASSLHNKTVVSPTPAKPKFSAWQKRELSKQAGKLMSPPGKTRKKTPVFAVPSNTSSNSSSQPGRGRMLSRQTSVPALFASPVAPSPADRRIKFHRTPSSRHSFDDDSMDPLRHSLHLPSVLSSVHRKSSIRSEETTKTQLIKAQHPHELLRNGLTALLRCDGKPLPHWAESNFWKERDSMGRFIWKPKDPSLFSNVLNEWEYNCLCKAVIEQPFLSKYNRFFPEEGYFACKGCGHPLYSHASKFNAHIGWPAFGTCIEGGLEINWTHPVLGTSDVGLVEIHCRRCKCHIGDIVSEENKNTPRGTFLERHRVNGLSLKYVQRDLGRIVNYTFTLLDQSHKAF